MPYIILDRDGVINHESNEYIKSPDEWHPIPGSLEAIARLNGAGYRVFVATNQSGVARGFYDLEILSSIHEKCFELLRQMGGHIEEIFFCPHHPDELCFCRKPKPGLFFQIQKKYAIPLADTYYIGDSITDIEVARVVGCKPILVLTGNGKSTLDLHPELLATPHFNNLSDAVNFILS